MDKASIARGNRKRGKSVQRRVAKEFLGKNVGLFGGEDVEHKKFSIEVKGRASSSITKFMEQCENNCPKDKIPLVVLHITGQKYENDYVIFRAKHFKEIIK